MQSRHGRLDRRRSGLAEPADRRVSHRLTEFREEHEISVQTLMERVGRPAVPSEALEKLDLSDRAHATRHALAARLVFHESGDSQQRVAQIDVSSNTITTPDPSVAPATRTSSNVSRIDSASGPTNVPAAPPNRIACSGRPFATPPAIVNSSPSVMPNGAS